MELQAVLLLAHVVASASAAVEKFSSIAVDTEHVLGLTSEHSFGCVGMDWWPSSKCDYGSCPWGNASILNADLNNSMLQNALKELSPIYLRLGGSLSDFVRYEDGKTNCRPFSDPTKSTRLGYEIGSGCLTMKRWDELNTFCSKTQCSLLLDVGALFGRQNTSCPAQTDCHHTPVPCCTNWTGSWDPGNAESLLRYTKEKGYQIAGFEFGNELVANGGIEAHLTTDQYVHDFCMLKDLVSKIWSEEGEHRPKLITPDNAFEKKWYGEFLLKAIEAGCPPDIITWHQYLLGAGKDPNVGSRALDPNVLNQQILDGQNVQTTIIANSKGLPSPPEIWMGEAGGAYNSGRHLVTDAFHSSFWYLDGFGILSQKGHQTFCRQTLVGGNYGLLNTTTYEPNPDYYGLLLWQKLMGREVFHVNIHTTKEVSTPGTLRVYAHCDASTPGDLTILMMNLANDTVWNVNLTEPLTTLTREEYVMSSASLSSQELKLNGEYLQIEADTIPTLIPKTVHPPNEGDDRIILQPLTYGFFILRGAGLVPCMHTTEMKSSI